MKTLKIITGSMLLSLLLFSCNKNENAPNIANQEFTIQENSPAGTVVGEVEARDQDEGQVVNLEIIDGNEDGIFMMDPVTGLLSVDDPAKLDFETHTELLLKVSASDSHEKDPRESSATVKVLLTDENEFAPVVGDLVIELDENPSVNQVIGAVEATDQDSRQALQYSIRSGQASEYVQIDASTGSLSVLDPSVFDYESNQELLFEVVVKDVHENYKSVVGQVSINILNVLELTDEMAAHYPFNGDANNVVADKFHGSVYGAESVNDLNGNPNSALSFNGTEDYIMLGSDFDFPERSISFRFKADALPTYDYVNDPVNSWSTLLVADHPGLQNGGMHIAVSNIDGVDKIFVWKINMAPEMDPELISATIDLSKWHQVSILSSGTGIDLYLDGNLEASYQSNTSGCSHQGEPYMVACRGRLSAVRFLEGAMDEVMIHSRLLEELELSKLSEMQ